MWGVQSAGKEWRIAGFAWQSLKIGLQVYRVSRRLQDHESVERCDAAIAADIIAQVGRAAAGCDLERDRGVCGGECRRLLWGRGAWDWLGPELRLARSSQSL